ncbi:SWIB/MDM2 domain [Dillenia turbinata]|uniref:SWIB/MDM2 domain n=1 Tax=Dillenia turbinata TaxID=194707 RepID=A0AAN8USI9_9MAGN
MASRVLGGSRVLMAAAKAKAKAPTAGAAAAAKATRTLSKARPNGILKEIPVSPALAKFLGADEASRTGAVKKVWEYIKLHNLQNPANKKEIRCDDKLKTIFDGKDTVGFLEVARLLSQHFVKTT